MTQIPVTLLVGFLGSGKTTLLNHILTSDHGQKIAVIENDFGELNIEKEFIKKKEGGDDGSIIEMINGCLCCSMNGTLIQTLESLLERKEDFDHIVIEATGVASPGPIIQGFFMSHQVKENYFLNSVVTLVDAQYFFQNLQTTKKDPELYFEEQLVYSDYIVINKSDLIAEKFGEDFARDEEKKIKEHIRNLNPSCDLETTTFSQIKIEELLKRNAQGIEDLDSLRLEHPEEGPHKHHEHLEHGQGGIKPFSFKFKGLLDPTAFQFCLNSLMMKFRERIFRIKGIVYFENNETAVFLQGVNDHIEFHLSELKDGDLMNQFIFIGIDLNNEVIEKSVKNCLMKPSKSS